MPAHLPPGTGLERTCNLSVIKHNKSRALSVDLAATQMKQIKANEGKWRQIKVNEQNEGR